MRVVNAKMENPDPILGDQPEILWHTGAPDGDAEPWVSAPLGSLHLRKASGSVIVSLKTATAGADADWTQISSSTTRTGYIPLPLTSWRLIASNDIPAVGTPDGGIISLDTAPSLKRVNGATDKQLRIAWAAAGVVEITQQFSYPPDLDDAAVVVFNFLGAMAGATDIPVVAVGYFEGVGDTNAGGNSGAVTGTTVAQYTVSIAATNVGAYPKAASVSLTPAAHGTDILYIYNTWVTYTRK